ncbi:hypothetical protein GCM10020258_25010 [Sphingomonas yabuuchiae]
MLTAALKQRETAEGKASLIANSVIVDGDPSAADRQIAAVQKVTAADIQRVARTYLKDSQSATIRYLPDSERPANVRLMPIEIAPTVQTAALTPPANIEVVTPAPEGQRILPPRPARPSPHPAATGRDHAAQRPARRDGRAARFAARHRLAGGAGRRGDRSGGQGGRKQPVVRADDQGYHDPLGDGDRARGRKPGRIDCGRSLG